MRFDRLVGTALIVIGTLALFSRNIDAGFGFGRGMEVLDTREEALDLADVRIVELEVEAGTLLIVGDRDGSAGSLRAEFRGPGQATLEGLELTHSVEGERLRIVSRTSRSRGLIDIELRLPAGVELRIDDGSGSIRVDGIDGRVSIEDGSGSIAVSDLGSDLRVRDGSGSVSVDRVSGTVHVEDGSGSIRVTSTGGSVEIHDGSGSISVTGAGGDVTVRDDSGSIRVRDVDGRFRLLSDGSGSVSTNRIRGGIDS